MKKRAETGDSFYFGGTIILASIIILAVIVLIFPRLLSNIFGDIGSQSEQGVNANLVALSDKVQSLIDDSEPTKSVYDFPYYISSDYILVGFSKQWDETKISKDGSWALAEKMMKPAECINKACLCIYKNKIGTDFGDQPGKNLPVRCVSFKEDVVFLGVANENTNFGIKQTKISGYAGLFKDYENLVLYGNKVDGDKMFYIDKIKIDSKFYVFFAVQKKAVAAFSEQTKRYEPEEILTKLIEEFKTKLPNLCDSSNGKPYSEPGLTPMNGYIPKEGVNCIAGPNFMSEINTFISKNYGDRDIRLQISKSSEEILDYQEHGTADKYSKEMNEGDFIVKLSISYDYQS
jgi:hypothetical protein